jgi:thiamine kinase-like enzyme
MKQIAGTFSVSESGIRDIKPLKEGMTNQSFVFSIGADKYVFRKPGAGTDKLINRKNEKATYRAIEALGVADELIRFDGKTGEKISKYYDGARVADPYNDEDVSRSMSLLREIHENMPALNHRFNIGGMIDFYERIAKENDAIRFSDYEEVRGKADELLSLERKLKIPHRLCHIDYVYTNILFLKEGGIRVIDWEYSGNADPLIDVAMWSIFAYYDRKQADHALECYLGRAPVFSEGTRLYMYMALGAFLWSLWSEYKQSQGEEFGEYLLIMYRYMKDYYNIIREEGRFDVNN